MHINWILTYRLHIAFLFATVLLVVIQSLQIKQFPWWAVVSFTCWNYSAYLINRVTDIKEDTISQPTEAIKSQREVFFIYLISSLLLFGPLLALIAFRKNFIPYLLLTPLGWLYSLPVPKIGKIKQIFFIKNIYSAVVGWGLPIFIVVYAYSETPISQLKLLLMTIEIACINLIFEFIWDIRDIFGDCASSVRTLPNTWGIVFTKFFAFFLLISLLLFKSIYHPSGLIFIFTFFSMCILAVNKNRTAFFYHGIILFYNGVLLSHLLTKA